jgi:hypothetical protein
VFEAIAGATPRPLVLTPVQAVVLRRALAPLHRAGVAHGSIGDSVVLETHGPVLLLAGRAPTPVSAEEEQRQIERATSAG